MITAQYGSSSSSGGVVVIAVIVLLVIWLALVLGTMRLAKSKGRSVGEGAALALLFGLIGLIIEALLPRKLPRSPGQYSPYPHPPPPPGYPPHSPPGQQYPQPGQYLPPEQQHPPGQ